MYISSGGKGAIHNRYSDFKQWLINNPNTPIEVPEVSIRDHVGFINGRHRFAVMRDLGMESIPVCTDTKSIQIDKNKGLLA